jgi:alpha-beta hydrolase superfamily lysophospholipase
MFRILKRTAAGTVVAAILATTVSCSASLTSASANPAPQASCAESAAPEKALRCLSMRDGTVLAAQSFTADSDLTIVLLHGVLNSSAGMQKTARLLHDAANASVLALDLRGHGKSGGRPGDNDYIGQWEDDVADVVKHIRNEKPNGRIVLAGHAVGGGVVMRYAEKTKLPPVDGYLLFAPDLGWESPTTRKESPPEAAPKSGPKPEPFMKVDLGRIIKLKAMNAVGITSSNDQVTLTFNVPKTFPVSKYTYRAMMTFSPDDYRVALAADTRPLLLVAGSKDEAFHANRYPAAMSSRPSAKVVLVEGETHLGVLHSAGTVAAVRDWLPTLRK